MDSAQFYPIVLTRTALRNSAKGREGYDFALRVCPPNFSSELRELIGEAINEDRYPSATTPRRVYYRTSEFVLWGLALHNEWFLPSETTEALDLSDGEKRLRGFWGGTIDLKQIDAATLKNDVLPRIAASLLEIETSCAPLDETLERSEKRASADVGADGSNDEVARPPVEFVGRSPFVFAARLFQRFVQKDWFNYRAPILASQRNFANAKAPLISQDPFDLTLFAPSFELAAAEANDGWRDLSSERLSDVFAESLAASWKAGDVAATNEIWTRLILADKEVCVVAPFAESRHADAVAAVVPRLKETVLYAANKEEEPRVYSAKPAPPEPKPVPKPKEESDQEGERDERQTRRFRDDSLSPESEEEREKRTFFGKFAGSCVEQINARIDQVGEWGRKVFPKRDARDISSRELDDEQTVRSRNADARPRKSKKTSQEEDQFADFKPFAGRESSASKRSKKGDGMFGGLQNDDNQEKNKELD